MRREYRGQGSEVSVLTVPVPCPPQHFTSHSGLQMFVSGSNPNSGKKQDPSDSEGELSETPGACWLNRQGCSLGKDMGFGFPAVPFP